MNGKRFKTQATGGVTFVLILVCLFSLWQSPAYARASKEHQMLSPTNQGSAWNLPAGVYAVEEEVDQGSSTTGYGGSPSASDSPAPAGGYGGSPSASDSPAPAGGYGGSPSASDSPAPAGGYGGSPTRN